MFCRLVRGILTLLFLLWGHHAGAQTYPTKPLGLIVPFAAGGSSDVMARITAKAMTAGLGQQIVIENKPGAGGNIGAEFVARSAPDGYTLLFGTNGSMGFARALDNKNSSYDPINGFTPVGILHTLPLVLIVHKSVPAQNLKELIAYGRANPGKLSFASAGNMSTSHLAGELLKSVAGLDLVHIPYRGGGAATADLITGRVSMMIETVTNALALVQTGYMRAFAVTTGRRAASLPNLPTFAEAGLQGYVVSTWTGLFMPAGTPPPIVARVNAETHRIVANTDYVEHMKKIGTDVVSSTPEEFQIFQRAEIQRWVEVIQRSGVKLE